MAIDGQALCSCQREQCCDFEAQPFYISCQRPDSRAQAIDSGRQGVDSSRQRLGIKSKQIDGYVLSFDSHVLLGDGTASLCGA